MSSFSSHVRVVGALALFLMMTAFPVAAQNGVSLDQHLHIEPTPAWVEVTVPADAEQIPVNEVNDGVYYLLVEDQQKVEQSGEQARYSRIRQKAVNAAGVESISQINVDFDPVYQKLVLNSLVVERNGERIDRLNDARMTVFSRETDLEDQIYNGQLTLNVLLDDIRVGDTVDYSFTEYGSNPVYQGIFAMSRGLNWAIPVFQQNVSVLWGKSSPLNVSFRNIDPEVTQTKSGSYTRYDIRLENEPTLEQPSETPRWYRPFGRVYFEEVDDWAAVVEWAHPMYQLATVHPAVRQVADGLASSAQSPQEFILAALNFAQEEIRYVGIELGQNSHFPTPPEETLEQKYGDCKDKTLLFIELLRAGGVEAHPALVNTYSTRLLSELPAGPTRFDHVIAWLEHDGKEYWLDPTLSGQVGGLDTLYQPDYGYALILDDGVDELRRMGSEGHRSGLDVLETYTLPASYDEPVGFTVVSTYSGYRAMRVQWSLEQEGKTTVAKEYEDWYQRFFPGVRMVDDLLVAVDEAAGTLRLEERYEIDDFWTIENDRAEADFYATDIRELLYKPDRVDRQSPMRFTYPASIRTRTVLEFGDDGWSFDPEDLTESNAMFDYVSSVRFSGNTLTLDYALDTKMDHVPAEALDAYLTSRDKVRGDTVYGIYRNLNTAAADASASGEDAGDVDDLWVGLIALGVLAFYIIGFVLVFISWRIESSKRPDFPGVEFYPMTISKFIVLSIASFGMYNLYWMYRNWKAEAARSGQPMMPFWRGFFAFVWVYPLFNALKADSETHYATNRVAPEWLAALIALAYLLISIGASLDTYRWQWLAIFLLPMPLIPLLRYIRERNQGVPEACAYNSKWRWRHVLAVLMAVPLMAILAMSQSPYFPSDRVVTQEELLDRDVQFLYRQNLLSSGETLKYFYSDAIFSVRRDGNGLTDKRIFSYWMEGDELTTEFAYFEDIESLDIQSAENSFETTVITVVRKDQSEFVVFVSAVEKGDQPFINELQALWQASQPPEE